jgi:hypothetical protein
MQKSSTWTRIALAIMILLCNVPSAAQTAPPQDSPARIFDDAKGEFFKTIENLLLRHPRRNELTGDEALRIYNAKADIPYLFERVMLLAYQKDEPRFAEWLRKGDAESLKMFRQEFIDLAKEYAARFVGSLFRQSNSVEFEMALPHNRGKGRLELVLQTLGYNAKNDPPDVPQEKRFTNKIGPEFYNQWTVAALNATRAQQVSRGAGVIVAVIDSGIDPYNSLFKDRLLPGFTFVQRTQAPWQDDPVSANTVDWGWHGTVVASELMLVAPDCRILPIRMLDGDTMNDPVYPYWMYEYLAASIFYAVHHGAHIVQISAAVPSSEPVVWQAVRYAFNHNVVVSTSAGNISRWQWGLDPAQKLYRSFDHEVLLVGGVEHKHGKYLPWWGTLPGPQITVGVPAADMYMIAPIYANDMKDSFGSGTSLASPLVSGVVALMRSAAPPSDKLLAQPGAYVRLVSETLKNTARLDILGLTDPNDIVGHGLVDAYAAVERIQQTLPALGKAR